jgi:prepilin-type N-terminal cleavage/methylation domain-containing protein
MTPAHARERSGAFTLLEILAVVAIFALIAGIALPNFSVLHSRSLRNQAQKLVAQLELARQRAIVTGVPHRIYIDIDDGAYRIEWLGTRAEPGDDPDDSAADAGVTSDSYTLDLTPPRADEREFEPIAGSLGRFTELDDASFFAGIETTGGWVHAGDTNIRFEQDGSADATTIVLEHEAGYAATLEVLPLASTIRVQHETL